MGRSRKHELSSPSRGPRLRHFPVLRSQLEGQGPGNKLTWKAKEPYWIYAEDYQIPTGDLHFVDDAWAQYKDKTVPQNQTGRWAKKGSVGLGEPEDITRTWVTHGYKHNNFSASVRDVAAKVEWYNEAYGSWSSPQVSPDSVPITNSMGLTKVIFRFPRQLDSVTDRDILKEAHRTWCQLRLCYHKEVLPIPTTSRPKF